MNYLFIIIGILLAGLACLYIDSVSFDSNWDLPGIWLLVICGLALVIFLVIIPIERMENKVLIAQHGAFVETLESARTNGVDIEGAAILAKIADWNEEITDLQYRKENYPGWCGIFIPDEVLTLKLIR